MPHSRPTWCPGFLTKLQISLIPHPKVILTRRPSPTDGSSRFENYIYQTLIRELLRVATDSDCFCKLVTLVCWNAETDFAIGIPTCLKKSSGCLSATCAGGGWRISRNSSEATVRLKSRYANLCNRRASWSGNQQKGADHSAKPVPQESIPRSIDEDNSSQRSLVLRWRFCIRYCGPLSPAWSRLLTSSWNTENVRTGRRSSGSWGVTLGLLGRMWRLGCQLWF